MWANPHLSGRRKRSEVERNSSSTVCQVTERAGVPYHCRRRLLLPLVGYYGDVLFLCFNYLL